VSFSSNHLIEVDAVAQREWILKRNCSISPRQLALFYASLCLVSLLLASIFTVQGAWFVLVFSVIEMSAVGAAFLYYARHANDREHIMLVDGCLVVELIESEISRQYRFDTRWLQVEPPGLGRGLIGLKTGGMQLEVGRFLTQFKRREFALELTHAIGSGR
jgi:uncharacterized membrane protein